MPRLPAVCEGEGHILSPVHFSFLSSARLPLLTRSPGFPCRPNASHEPSPRLFIAPQTSPVTQEWDLKKKKMLHLPLCDT